MKTKFIRFPLKDVLLTPEEFYQRYLLPMAEEARAERVAPKRKVFKKTLQGYGLSLILSCGHAARIQFPEHDGLEIPDEIPCEECGKTV